MNNLFYLKEALVNTGICTQQTFSDFRINASVSDGFRYHNASVRRFFVFEGEQLICSVKMLPATGFFDVKNLKGTQELFRSFEASTAPKIIGIYQSETGNLYIVEEGIGNCINLDKSLNSGMISREGAGKIIENIFCEIANQPAQEPKPQLLEQELTEFFQGAKLAGLPEELIKVEIEKYFTAIDSLSGQVFLVSGDILPGNIMLGENRNIVVDFDLSRKTHFLCIELLRTHYYSKLLSRDFINRFINPEFPTGLPDLLFLLREVYLQHSVLNEDGFKQALKFLLPDLQSVLKRYFGINWRMPEADCGSIFCFIDGVIPENLPLKLNKAFGESRLQIFWRSNEQSFCEENSLSIPFLIDSEFHEYTIFFPEIVTDVIRIDFGNQPALIEIKNIRLGTADDKGRINEPVKVWSPLSTKGFKAGMGVLELDHSDNLRLLSISSDPQILLSTESISDLGQRLAISITIRIILEVPGELAGEINETKEKLRNETHNLKSKLDENYHQISYLNAKLDEENDQISYLNAKLEQKQIQLEGVFNSRSWRLTRFLRGITRAFKFFKKKSSRLCLSFSSDDLKVKLVPSQDIIQGAGLGEWIAISNDPQFIVDTLLPLGLVEFNIDISLPGPGIMKFYLDKGNGFCEKESTSFQIEEQGRHSIKIGLYAGLRLRAIRFDPFDSKGLISIHSISLRSNRRHRLFRANKLLKSYISDNVGLLKSGIARRTLRAGTQKNQDLRHTDIIIPIYNALEDLRACVASVLANTTGDYNLILIDDCSPDPEIGIYLNELADRRLENVFIKRNNRNLVFLVL